MEGKMLPQYKKCLIEYFSRKNLRFLVQKFLKSMAARLVFTAFIVFFSMAIATYYIESKNVFYTVENGQRVEDSSRSSNIRTLEDSIWWTFVTSTTVGYGDFYPKSRGGRLVGIIAMFFGVSLMGVITGNIASFLVEKQLKEGRGLKNLKLRNHFIICGWKREMTQILLDILEKNHNFLASEIVLINQASPDLIDNLRMDRRLAHINFIFSENIDEHVLNKANIKQASKVLILADRLVTGSPTEVDSRTVMTVLTIKSISKTLYTAAELLDEKFVRYLHSSGCDEIILSTEYNRHLIANASTGSGISHVVNELLNVKSDSSINTCDIPARFIGRQFDELAGHYKNERVILIGILENTGNFFTRKKEALRDAQKTPDISRLVDNLKVVKSLVPNQPVINPGDNYIIKEYSRAIIIEGRV